VTRARPTLPHGHGEVLTAPPFVSWAQSAQDAAIASALWNADVDGEPLPHLRLTARREALAAAEAFCRRFDIEVATPPDPSLVIVTGHQPSLFHPGVWIKNFLVDRCVNESVSAGRPTVGLNLVVDSDGFDSVSLVAPCLGAEVGRCVQYLAVGTSDGCYSCSSVPSTEDIEEFCEGGRRMLATLPAPAIGRHFEDFCVQLRATAPQAENLGELLAVARRRFEAPTGTAYLELPVTELSSTRTFRRFVSHLAANAERFANDYNAELAAFRAATQTRSAAQPFPDLTIRSDAVELPFWVLDGKVRTTLWVRTHDCALVMPEQNSLEFRTIADEMHLAPKALALTMYVRTFIADLFVHGVGGGRYDRVTDGVISRFFGIEAPPFAVASMTVYLPLGGHVVGDEEIAEARRRLHRFEHNPDAMLPEVDFDSAEERDRAVSLASEKAALVLEIQDPDADKKTLGARIRQVNAELAALLEPLARQLRVELESLEGQAASAEVFTDRTYPFCLWNPLEVQDKAR